MTRPLILLLVGSAIVWLALIVHATAVPQTSITQSRAAAARLSLQRLVTAPAGHPDRHPELLHPGISLERPR